MPRKPRLDSPGILHHIIARGIEGRNIFSDNADRDFFLERLGKNLANTNTICYAFTLMPNHFHLLLRTGSYPIATVMRRLLTSYAVRYNKRHKRVGHLFQNRYKDIICQEDIYLRELIRYIHLNAIRANIVESIAELNKFKYSSHRFLLNKNAVCNWYFRDEILRLFNQKEKKAVNVYQSFLADGINMGKRKEFSVGGLRRSLGFPKQMPKQKIIYDDRILGESDFVLKILTEKEQETASKLTKQYLGIEEIVIKVCQLYNLKKDELVGRGRTRIISNARALISYLGTKHLGLPAAEVAQYLKVNCSSIIRSISKGEKLAKQYSLMTQAEVMQTMQERP